WRSPSSSWWAFSPSAPRAPNGARRNWRRSKRSPVVAMKAKHRRLFFVSFGLALLAGAVTLALVALQDTVTFFFTPSQAAERSIPAGQRVRLGGLVEEKSIKKLADGV